MSGLYFTPPWLVFLSSLTCRILDSGLVLSGLVSGLAKGLVEVWKGGMGGVSGRLYPLLGSSLDEMFDSWFHVLLYTYTGEDRSMLCASSYAHAG